MNIIVIIKIVIIMIGVKIHCLFLRSRRFHYTLGHVNRPKVSVVVGPIIPQLCWPSPLPGFLTGIYRLSRLAHLWYVTGTNSITTIIRWTMSTSPKIDIYQYFHYTCDFSIPSRFINGQNILWTNFFVVLYFGFNHCRKFQKVWHN